MLTLAKLLVKQTDALNYTNYVFEVVDKDEIDRLGTKYILATRFPRWDHRKIEIGEVGYLSFIEIRAGLDKWFDGKEMIPYRYNTIQFIKFIKKPEPKTYKYTI